MGCSASTREQTKDKSQLSTSNKIDLNTNTSNVDEVNHSVSEKGDDDEDSLIFDTKMEIIKYKLSYLRKLAETNKDNKSICHIDWYKYINNIIFIIFT